MSKPHKIDLDEMLAWIEDSRRASVVYASSTKERKALEVRCAGGYAVFRDGLVVWEGTDGRTAVDKYNSIG